MRTLTNPLSERSFFLLPLVGAQLLGKNFFSSEKVKLEFPLFPNLQPQDHRAISLDILLLEIIEETSPLTYQFQKPSPGMMILCMGLEMFGQIIDPLAQDGDLNLRRPRIGNMSLVFLDDGLLLLWQ
jgi:hypothetical protein